MTTTETMTMRDAFDRVLMLAVGSAAARTAIDAKLAEVEKALADAEKMVDDLESHIATQKVDIDHLQHLLGLAEKRAEKRGRR